MAGLMPSAASIMPFWFALVSLRPHPDNGPAAARRHGFGVIVDVFAYFSGKASANTKLHHNQPCKSWEAQSAARFAVVHDCRTKRRIAGIRYRLVRYRVNRFGVDRCQRMRRPFGKLARAGRHQRQQQATCQDTAACSTVDSLIAVISVYAAMMSVLIICAVWKTLQDGIRYKVILIMTPQVLTILGSTPMLQAKARRTLSPATLKNSAYSRWQGISSNT